MSKTKKIVIAVVAVVAAAAVLLGVYFAFGKADTQQGSKTVTVTVTAGDYEKEHKLKTDAEFLGAALQEAEMIKGEESQYGLFITEVDGVAADSAKQEWWCVTKGGEMVMTGADATPIADGDSFELTLKVGY